jgi:hypothetical protein
VKNQKECCMKRLDTSSSTPLPGGKGESANATHFLIRPLCNRR